MNEVKKRAKIVNRQKENSLRKQEEEVRTKEKKYKRAPHDSACVCECVMHKLLSDGSNMV